MMLSPAAKTRQCKMQHRCSNNSSSTNKFLPPQKGGAVLKLLLNPSFRRFFLHTAPLGSLFPFCFSHYHRSIPGYTNQQLKAHPITPRVINLEQVIWNKLFSNHPLSLS
jgi:hypothetical protein